MLGIQGKISSALKVAWSPRNIEGWEQKKKKKTWVRGSAMGLKRFQKGQAKAEVVTRGPHTDLCVPLKGRQQAAP